MSDPAFVAAAYIVVLGGLAGYALSIGRRLRSAGRTTLAIEQMRRRGLAERVRDVNGTTPPSAERVER